MPPDFSPQKVLIDWKDAQGFTIADAQTGVAVFGATGSGKTSGPGQLLARAYLKAGFGGLVLCAKAEERRQWDTWAQATGRSADLVHVDTGGRARFNFLDWEASRAGDGAGFAINLVALLDEIAGAIDAQGSEGEGGGDNAFFRQALHHMLTNLVELPLLAGLPVSLRLMRAVATDAPLSLAQKADTGWQEKSACWRILREAEAATKDDPAKRADFEECRSYWEQDFPTLSDRTRSIITLMFSMLARPFITRPLRQLFSEDTTVTPEDTFAGKVIVVDLPVQEYRLAGRVAALVWKWCFQVAVMRRQGATGQRPVFLWADEAQNFITERDAEYQAVARSAGGCTVYLTQQREGIRRVLGSDDAAENLLANLQTKFFCQNSGGTNQWASDLLGSRLVMVTSTSVSRSGQHGGAAGLTADMTAQGGISRSEQWRPFVEAARFTTLKRGGPPSDYHVEAIAYCGGKLFGQDSAEPLPYKLLTFRQR